MFLYVFKKKLIHQRVAVGFSWFDLTGCKIDSGFSFAWGVSWHHVHAITPWLRLWSCSRFLELAPVFPSKSKLRSDSDARWEYFGIKCVGSHGAAGDKFNWMNMIPSSSSIPVEKLFWGDAVQLTRHRKQKCHTVRKKARLDTSDIAWGPTARDRCLYPTYSHKAPGWKISLILRMQS